MTESRTWSRYLYHYTKPDRAINILKERVFRPGTFLACNDPYESKEWNFAWRTATGNPVAHNLRELSQNATTILRRDWHVMCMTSDQPTDDPWHLGGATIAPMWAHYAANHRGVCLVFNANHLHRAVIASANARTAVVAWGFVDYSLRNYSLGLQHPANAAFTLDGDDIQRRGLETYLAEHSNKYHRELFLTKHPAWAYEQEFRYLIRTGDEQVAIPIEANIKGVIVGSDCPPEDVAEFGALGREYSIDVHMATWGNGNASVGAVVVYSPGVSTLFFGWRD